jgi:uncharacterized membrane protein
MLVKMADKKQVPVKPKIEKKPKTPSDFPLVFILFGLITFIVGVLNVLKIFSLDRLYVDAILIIAGLWIFKKGVGSGFSKKHRRLGKRLIN